MRDGTEIWANSQGDSRQPRSPPPVNTNKARARLMLKPPSHPLAAAPPPPAAPLQPRLDPHPPKAQGGHSLLPTPLPALAGCRNPTGAGGGRRRLQCPRAPSSSLVPSPGVGSLLMSVPERGTRGDAQREWWSDAPLSLALLLSLPLPFPVPVSAPHVGQRSGACSPPLSAVRTRGGGAVATEHGPSVAPETAKPLASAGHAAGRLPPLRAPGDLG